MYILYISLLRSCVSPMIYIHLTLRRCSLWRGYNVRQPQLLHCLMLPLITLPTNPLSLFFLKKPLGGCSWDRLQAYNNIARTWSSFRNHGLHWNYWLVLSSSPRECRLWPPAFAKEREKRRRKNFDFSEGIDSREWRKTTGQVNGVFTLQISLCLFVNTRREAGFMSKPVRDKES